MPLVTLLSGSLAYGELPLLDSASFSLEGGERLGLIGRNGTGKSSLLGVIVGTTRSTTASCAGATAWHRAGGAGARPPRLERDPEEAQARRVPRPFRPEGRPRPGGHVGRRARSASRSRRVRARARAAAARRAHQPSRHRRHPRLEELLLETACGDRRHARPRLPRPRRDAHRRARPRPAALLPGQLLAPTRREGRAARGRGGDAAQVRQALAQEEVWIRKGVEARRTRNEGRVRRLERLREERAARRERVGRREARDRRRPALRQARGRARRTSRKSFGGQSDRERPRPRRHRAATASA